MGERSTIDIDQRLERQLSPNDRSDIAYSSGDPGKAERLLGWKATKKMHRVVELLVEAEYRRQRPGFGANVALAFPLGQNC